MKGEGNGEELDGKPITNHSAIKKENYFLFYEGSNSIQPFPPFHSTQQKKKTFFFNWLHSMKGIVSLIGVD